MNRPEPWFGPGESEPASPRITEACERTLLTLLNGLAEWKEHVVLIGGLLPRYLVPEVPDGIDPHLGTRDLDLVLTLAITDEVPGVSLQERLEALWFSPERSDEGQPTFVWSRTVDTQKMKVEFMCPAGDGARLEVEPDPAPGVGERVGALRLEGAELVALDFEQCEIQGRDIEARPTEAVLKISGLLPFLVLKSFAFDERGKPKDAYDIVWVLTAIGDGPADAARMAFASPVASAEVVTRALGRLRHAFERRDSWGPDQYANFLLRHGPDEAKARLRAHAYLTVRIFLQTWEQSQRSTLSAASPPGTT